MTDSSTGGYLVPEGSPFPIPLQDAALDSFMKTFVAGVTGMNSDFVRPRWQPTPPPQPPITQDWVAIGVQNQQADTNAVVVHRQTTTEGVSADVVQRHERFELLCSLYGPNAGENTSRLREGVYLAQNREALQLAGMGLIKVGEILNLSTLINAQWYRRLDVIVYIARNVTRVYPVLDLLSSSGTIYSDLSGAQNWSTANVKGS